VSGAKGGHTPGLAATQTDLTANGIRRSAVRLTSVAAATVALLLGAKAFAQTPMDPTQYTEQDRRSLLPSPILDEQPAWVDLYWKAWALAQKNIMKGTAQNGFAPYYLTSAFPGTDLFAWDTEFCAMFGKYGNGAMPGIVSLDNWYLKQTADGGICRILSQINGSPGHPGWTNTDPETCARVDMNPPVYAWAEWQSFLISGDTARFSKSLAGRTVLQHLVDAFKFVELPANGHKAANGLYTWDPYSAGTDNTPGSYMYWVDLASEQALSAYCIARIAEAIGDSATEQTYDAQQAALVTLINKYHWDPATSFYYPLTSSLQPSGIKTAMGFWPLLARAPSQTQAAGLLAHLTNPSEFWRQQMVPTLSADDPSYDPGGGYWRGSTWAPTNYMIVKGFEAFGNRDIAFKVAENIVGGMSKTQIAESDHSIYENLAPDSFHRGNNSQTDFVGWSGLGPISLLIENVIGLSLDAPHRSVSWDMRLLGHHGMQNLNVGSATLSLTAAARTNAADAPTVSVTTTDTLTIEVTVGGPTATCTFPAGTYTWPVSFDAGMGNNCPTGGGVDGGVGGSNAGGSSGSPPDGSTAGAGGAGGANVGASGVGGNAIPTAGAAGAGPGLRNNAGSAASGCGCHAVGIRQTDLPPVASLSLLALSLAGSRFRRRREIRKTVGPRRGPGTRPEGGK
jgi:hypothetical protein